MGGKGRPEKCLAAAFPEVPTLRGPPSGTHPQAPALHPHPGNAHLSLDGRLWTNGQAWMLLLPIYTAALGKSYGSHEPGFPHLKRSMVPTVACHGLLCVSEKTCQSFYENTGDVRNGRHGNCRPLFAIDRSVAAMCPAGCFHFKLSCPRSSL